MRKGVLNLGFEWRGQTAGLPIGNGEGLAKTSPKRGSARVPQTGNNHESQDDMARTAGKRDKKLPTSRLAAGEYRSPLVGNNEQYNAQHSIESDGHELIKLSCPDYHYQCISEFSIHILYEYGQAT